MARTGRPSVFLDSYCDDVKQWLAEGKTLFAFSRHIGISTVTLFEWKKNHPDFAKSINDGEELKLAWGEQFVKETIDKPLTNNVAFVMYCRNYLRLRTKDKEDVPADNAEANDSLKKIADFLLKNKDE